MRGVLKIILIFSNPNARSKIFCPLCLQFLTSVLFSFSLQTMSAVAQKIRILLKAFDHAVLDDAAKTILETVKRTGAIVSGPVPMPVKIKKFTLNRSTFVNKDARDQYEIREHKRLIDINEATSQTIDHLQNLHLPAGVEVEIKMIG